MLSGIYQITFDGVEGRYIGLAMDIPDRIRCHIHSLRAGTCSSPELQRIFNAHGEHKLKHAVLERCAVRELSAKEVEWMHKLRPEFNRQVPDYDRLDKEGVLEWVLQIHESAPPMAYHLKAAPVWSIARKTGIHGGRKCDLCTTKAKPGFRFCQKHITATRKRMADSGYLVPVVGGPGRCARPKRIPNEREMWDIGIRAMEDAPCN